MGQPNTGASSWVVRFAPLVRPGGSVLDVACGSGRHTRFFLDRDHPVTAIDRDIGQPDLLLGAQTVQADLEDGTPWPLPGQRFAAIVMTNYLWRPLLPTLLDSLDQGGVLIVETFAEGNERFGRPRNPQFLLGRGELLMAAQGLTIVAFEDGIVEDRAVIQRICAVGSPGPIPLPTR